MQISLYFDRLFVYHKALMCALVNKSKIIGCLCYIHVHYIILKCTLLIFKNFHTCILGNYIAIVMLVIELGVGALLK